LLELYYNDSNYADFIHTCARLFNTKAAKNHLAIPANYGKGYLTAFVLPEGISVLLGDTAFKEDIYLQRNACPNHQFFVLQVNEVTGGEEKPLKQPAGADVQNMQHSLVHLANSLVLARFIIPAHIRVRTVKLIFEKQHLLNLVGQETADKFIAGYFSSLVKKANTEALDAEYRGLLHELLKFNDDHPLKNAFLCNRVLLLLERFLLHFLERMHPGESAINLKDDEINKLIKVEALLVKDFSTAPPTIAALSKISAMSPTKLKKDFKTMYGMPVYEYYQKNRMMRAKALLEEENYAIKHVGMMVGYANLGHFAASFKKEFGILPSELINAGKDNNFVTGGNDGTGGG